MFDLSKLVSFDPSDRRYSSNAALISSVRSMAGTFAAESLPRSFRIAVYADAQSVGFVIPVAAVPFEVSRAVRNVSASSTSPVAADLV